MTTRAVLYVRVSTDPGERGRSVAEQEDECRAVCERNGWDVVRVFSDNDRSASRYATKGRPGYARLIRFIESGAADVLVVWESSRGTRDLAEYVALRKLLETYGVLLSYSGRTYDMAEGEDRFASGFDSLIAEKSSEETRKRVLRALRANAEKDGNPHGKVLYGYRREYETVKGKPELVRQVPDEMTAPIVQEAARRVLGGETPYAVAQDLNRRGIPTPRGGEGWDLTQVRRLCVNPSYAGKRVYRGKVVGKASWPPLLTEVEHLALVARLTDPSRKSRRVSVVRHLLTGVARCGVCDGRVEVQKNRGWLAYLCADHFHVSRKEDDVDAYVSEAIIERLERPDLAAALAADADAADAETAAAMAEAAELRNRLNGFYDAAAAGEIDPLGISRIESGLLPRIAAAERRARHAVLSPLVADVAGPGAADRWDRLSMAQQREVIAELATVRILPTVRGARRFRPESVEVTWRTDLGRA